MKTSYNICAHHSISTTPVDWVFQQTNRLPPTKKSQQNLLFTPEKCSEYRCFVPRDAPSRTAVFLGMSNLLTLGSELFQPLNLHFPALLCVCTQGMPYPQQGMYPPPQPGMYGRYPGAQQVGAPSGPTYIQPHPNPNARRGGSTTQQVRPQGRALPCSLACARLGVDFDCAACSLRPPPRRDEALLV